MLYKYDKTTLNYRKVTGTWIITALCFILISVAITSIITMNRLNDVRFISEETKAIILREADKQNEFSREKLKAYILELNVKYPHIVMAQAELETGSFKSKIFKENHNLFGMKVATKRPTTNKGEENGHAYYENWRESVVDYAFYSAQYLSNIKSEAEYFEYLKQSYAEDPNYVEKLKQIIKNHQ
jgi:flagellum-specific peptidoglycan hydrolase FlgJ